MPLDDATAGCNQPERSQPVFRAASAVLAEHIRLILALCEIRAAVIQRDPLHITVAVAEVIVAATDCGRAFNALNMTIQPSHGPDWDCPFCGEPVPSNFDLCWSCGTLHPSLDLENRQAIERSPTEHVA
jgi:hypothetical protein